MTCLEAALAYAGRDWKVFPLHRMIAGACSCGRASCSSPGKHPRTPNGVKDATLDAEVIRMWWKTWPESNVGIATGLASDLYVIDVEAEACDAIDPNLYGGTRLVAITGGGGLHLYYRLPLDVLDEPVSLPNTHWKLQRLVDTRGTGGYVAAPPSNHHSGGDYVWSEEGEPARLPADLHDRVKPALATPTAPPVIRYESTRYGEGVLRNAIERIACAAEGQRNNVLNAEAFLVGQFVGGGEVDPRGIAEALLVAAPDPDRKKSETTIRRALYDGSQYPRKKEPA